MSSNEMMYLKMVLELIAISSDFINTNSIHDENSNIVCDSSYNGVIISIKVIKVFDNLILLHCNLLGNDSVTTLRIDPYDYLFDSSYLFNDIKQLLDTNDVTTIKKYIDDLNPDTSTYNLIIKIRCNLLEPLLSQSGIELANLSYLSSYLLENILSFTSGTELVLFGATTKTFFRNANADHLWRNLLPSKALVPNHSPKKQYIQVYKQKRTEEKNRVHRHLVAYGQAPLTPFALPSNVPWIVGHNGGGFIGSDFVGNPRFRMNVNNVQNPLNGRPQHRFGF